MKDQRDPVWEMTTFSACCWLLCGCKDDISPTHGPQLDAVLAL